MMTLHANAIIAGAFLPSEIMFADADVRMSQLASQPRESDAATRPAPVPVAAPVRRMPLVLVLEDGAAMSTSLRQIGDFLDICVDRINTTEDLLPFLQRCKPMAVVASMDAAGQDGGNVLKTVARHDPTLPVLLMTDGDPALAGAADAVIEVWGLTEVVQSDAWPAPGAMVEFLCRAGLRGNCLALLPI